MSAGCRGNLAKLIERAEEQRDRVEDLGARYFFRRFLLFPQPLRFLCFLALAAHFVPDWDAVPDAGGGGVGASPAPPSDAAALSKGW